MRATLRRELDLAGAHLETVDVEVVERHGAGARQRLVDTAGQAPNV